MLALQATYLEADRQAAMRRCWFRRPGANKELVARRAPTIFAWRACRRARSFVDLSQRERAHALRAATKRAAALSVPALLPRPRAPLAPRPPKPSRRRGRGAKHANQRSFMRGRVLPVALPTVAESFNVEKIVRDLECFAERGAVTFERVPLGCVGLAQNCASRASEPQECAGFHGLKDPHALLRHRGRFCLEPSFGREIQHLPAYHPADTGGARQRGHEVQANFGVGMRLRPAENVKGERSPSPASTAVASSNALCVVGLLPQLVVVHGGQVVMDERVAVRPFQSRPAINEPRRTLNSADSTTGRLQALPWASRPHSASQMRRWGGRLPPSMGACQQPVALPLERRRRAAVGKRPGYRSLRRDLRAGHRCHHGP